MKIFFHTGHHKDLLVLLGRLGQRVKLAWMQSARDEEFTGAFRCTLEQRGRFNLEEALFLHEYPRRSGHAAPQTHVVDHLRPAQVEIAVLEAEFLVDLGGDLRVVDAERQHVGVVQHLELLSYDLDEAGVDLLVLRALGADADLAGDADDTLAMKPRGGLEQVGRKVARIKHRLCSAFAVSDIDKEDSAQVSVGMYPAVEGDDLSNVFLAYFVAVMCALHSRKKCSVP